MEDTGLVSGRGSTMPFRKKVVIGAIALLGLGIVIMIIVGAVMITRTEQDDHIFVERYKEAMHIGPVMDHLRDLENIALEHNNSRAVEYGFNASADYIVSMLKEHTDYEVSVQTFPVILYNTLEPATLNLVSENRPLIAGTDFNEMGGFGGLLNITAPVSNVLNQGCDPTDYAGFPKGHVALIMRGNCTFNEKITLAGKANASAALIYNDGAEPNREGLFNGDPGQQNPIPAFAIPFLLGDTIRELPAPEVNFYVYTEEIIYITRNILADTKRGSSEDIIVVGSHLDSVAAGPGINDNGSGSCTNLELAIQLYKAHTPIRNKVRFAWWGAEERGLLGSKWYVAHLSEEDKGKIVLNLNFDMLGSPNYVFGIYNGSGAAEEIRAASQTIQQTFEAFFENNELPYELSPFTGRSDYGPFIENGIPAGGLAAGADEVKTVEQRKLFGGLAETILDPCYHKACDTVANINEHCLETMGQAAAYTLGTLALKKNLRDFLVD